MPRQPFKTTRPKAHYYINQNCMADRPAMAALIARCLTFWSQIDVEMSLLLAALLDTRSDAAVAVYLSLTNAKAQRDALASAAQISLSGETLALFNAVMKIHKSSSGERNDLAHGIFGIVSDAHDELIWCPSTKFAAWMTRANQKAWNLEFDPDPHAPLRNELFIYKTSDLEILFEQFCFVFDVVTRLHMAIAPLPQGATNFGLDWLLSQPQIRAELGLEVR
jgi:hypothetical protein